LCGCYLDISWRIDGGLMEVWLRKEGEKREEKEGLRGGNVVFGMR
jgi:hypothetical protein